MKWWLAACFLLVTTVMPVRADTVHYYNDDICIAAQISGKNGENPIDLSLEIAVTPEKTRQGLMYRDYLPSLGGMIFIFTPPQETAMWMKNTFIPLDMLFVDKDRRVIKAHQGAKPHDLTPIWSGGAAHYVIELPAGSIERHGFKKGDILHLPETLFDGL